jgi:hypothetical protein
MLVQRFAQDYRPLIAGFNSGEPVTIRFSYPAKETLVTINSFIAQLFSEHDRIFLLESVITIVREAVYNAIKANAKRIFFEASGRDITNSSEYT